MSVNEIKELADEYQDDEVYEEKTEYHINTWDAGWYQIKGLLNQYMKDDYKVFVSLYKCLEDKMRPMVYELGFLM